VSKSIDSRHKYQVFFHWSRLSSEVKETCLLK